MKRLALLVLSLILLMGTMGVAYAKWSDTVNLSANVSSGTICTTWYLASDLDACAGTGVSEGDPELDLAEFNTEGTINYVYTDKNVACTSVNGLGTNTLTVTVTNAYPLYYGDLGVQFCNCGNIPVKIQDIKITPVGFDLSTSAWDPDHCDGPLWIDVSDGLGTQLDPISWCAGGNTDHNVCCKLAHFRFVVQECAQQGASYTFNITWTLVQWNEYTP